MDKISVRPYFSYSQMSAFKYSQNRFLENYYYGEQQESVYLDMGKKLGSAIQFRKSKSDKIIDKIRRQVPDCEIYEFEIKTIFKKIPLLCYLDGFNKKDFSVMELKTGKSPSLASWTDQMKFYSLALYKKYGKLPSKIELYYCRTEFNENDQLVLTGEVKKYPIVITMNDVIQFSSELVKIYSEIQKLIDKEYQQFGILPSKGRSRK